MHRSARSESRLRIGESDRRASHLFQHHRALPRDAAYASDAQRFAARASSCAIERIVGGPARSPRSSPMRTGAPRGPDQFTDIPAGPILLRHVSDLYCYPNTLAVLRVRGQRPVRLAGTRGVDLHRIDPATLRAQPLIDHDFAGYNFDRIDGLPTRSTSACPPEPMPGESGSSTRPGRIRNLRHADGRPVDPDEETLVVTNSYRAAGGGSFPVCARSETVVR
jgi:2',3'-cyclic-nucleotide 2'-phosphodiesterase/3'-nucleotidase